MPTRISVESSRRCFAERRTSEGAMTKLRGIVDLHSHLVPGVDDGAADLDQAIEGLGQLLKAGVSTAVLTPHLQASLTLESAELQTRLDEVDRARSRLYEAWSATNGDDLRLLEGFEIALDRPDVRLEDPRLRLAGTDYVLVEWPGMRLPHEDASVRVLARLVEEGWRPILAHPERYGGMADALWVIDAWRDVGVHLQINVGSVIGAHGRVPQEIAFKLLHESKADLMASDYHGWPVRPPGLLDVADWFSQRSQEAVFEMLMVTNPRRLIEGRNLEEVPELPEEPGLVERMRRRWLSRIRRST
jgi:protein-tyrosine phosphatase